MQFRFFRISALDSHASAAELNQFLQSHTILRIEKEFVSGPTDSYWAFCLTYTTEKQPAKSKSSTDYREQLSTSQFAVFSRMRDVRKQLSEADGVPVYAVATNEQLAAMVRQPATSTADLHRLAGFGKAKIEKYGSQLLAAIKESLEDLTESTASSNG